MSRAKGQIHSVVKTTGLDSNQHTASTITFLHTEVLSRINLVGPAGMYIEIYPLLLWLPFLATTKMVRSDGFQKVSVNGSHMLHVWNLCLHLP